MILVFVGVVALSLAFPLAAAASAVLLGLSYGQINPVSTQILASITMPRSRPFVFSIKQTGMPVGAALAGAVLLSSAYDWKVAILTIGGMAVFLAVAIEAPRDGFDTKRSSTYPLRMTEPIKLSWRNCRLRCSMPPRRHGRSP